MRNRPPRIRIRSRPEISFPIVNRGSVNPITHVIDRSSAMRMNIANDRPTLRARSRSSLRSFPARIEMKTMLSMPRTISSTVSVPSAIHPSGLETQSNALVRKSTCASGDGAALGNLLETAPRVGVLPHQCGQVERHVLRWISGSERFRGLLETLRCRRFHLFVVDQAILVCDPERL